MRPPLVLIPLISGLCYYRRRQGSRLRRGRLNPFDFRALLLLLRGDYLHSFSDLALLFASFVRRRAAVYVLGVGEAKAA